ncbi:MAG: hypothetical protein KJ886_00160 [Candidatus Thermoplasmatota archaeon]|nr:hypothetical protein [Candidatus Thermoplasmatota archaeon]MCG2826010.1 hypothetical protein [Thermoplasmatales archaeon]
MIGTKETDAVIEDVRGYTDKHCFVEKFENCYDIDELYSGKRHKLYGDTDVIVVDLKTSEGKKVTDTFPVTLKFDGTLQEPALSRRNRLRRNRFVTALKHYKIAEEIKGCNILEKMKECKGKKVKIIRRGGRDQIFIPHFTPYA